MAEIVLRIQDLEEIAKSAKELIENNPGIYTDTVEISLKRRNRAFGKADSVSVVVLPEKAAYLPENVYKNF